MEQNEKNKVLVNDNESKHDTDSNFELPAKVTLLLLALAVLGGFAGGIISSMTYDKETLIGDKSNEEIIENVNDESKLIISVSEKVSPSVVSITSETRNVGAFGLSRRTTGAGTGIILTSDGLILTNKHVVPENTVDVSIVTNDGTRYEAEVVDRDPFNDIAFLKAKDVKGLNPAQIGNSDNVQVGEKVIAIGNALGRFQNTVTMGIISGKSRPVTARGADAETELLSNLFQTDAAINQGNSGGPLVNLNGEVIAVNTAIAAGSENIGFAIPINDVKAAISSVREEGKIIRPFIGISYVPITPSVSRQLDLPVNNGALITSNQGNPIVSGSPAEEAGLKDGDIITAVSGQKIDSNNSLISLLNQYKVGQTITLTVLRDNEKIEVELTLAEVPTSSD